MLAAACMMWVYTEGFVYFEDVRMTAVDLILKLSWWKDIVNAGMEKIR